MAGVAIGLLGALSPFIGQAVGKYILPKALPLLGNIVSKAPLGAIGQVGQNLMRFGGREAVKRLTGTAGSILGFGSGAFAGTLGQGLYNRSKNQLDPQDLRSLGSLRGELNNTPLGDYSHYGSSISDNRNISYLTALRNLHNKEQKLQIERANIEATRRFDPNMEDINRQFLN
jgi:hypothetical protein